MGRSPTRRSRVTLADVAKHAGVSVTTASFVLSGRTEMRISTATADRVRQAARVLNYARGPQTLAARAARLPVIGFVTDSVATDHFAGEMIRGAIFAAAANGYGLFTANTEGERSLEAELVRDLIGRGVEQFVYAALSTRTVQPAAVLKGHRTVLLNCVEARSSTAAVVPDEQAAGALAVTTLLQAGHTDAIWLVGESRGETSAGRERHAAVTATLKRQGLTLARHLSCAWWPPNARAAVAAALSRTRPARAPTAVIAMNDRVAMGVYQAATAAHLRIPEDLSVISFDNSELAWWLSPELTTIGLPYFEMGRRAVEVLVGGPPTGQVEFLPMPLHSRESVAEPRDRRG